MRKIVRTPDYPIVETKLGKLHGYQQDEVFHFHGIRYGTAERFQLPVMEKPWKGVRDAKSYGYVCPLMPGNIEDQVSVVHDPEAEKNPMAAPFSSFEMPHVYWPMSEQCLYLNIWTKHLDPAAKRPVMVWLHGGGFGAGSSVELPSYDGHNFSDYGDVVFVNLNHRLNCIGFLDLSAFGEEYKYSGIAGMADIVLALQWVKENIAFFGGDPDNVTVAGQSGGGGKATMLLQMSAADGLYHKVISQSGALLKHTHKTLAEEKKYWQELGRQTVNILGLDETSIDRIREISYEELSQAVTSAGRKLGCREGMLLLEPSPVEGYYEGPYYLAGFREETAHIPYIAGTVFGEFSFMHYLGDKSRYTERGKMDLLREMYGDHTERARELFSEIYPEKDILYALSVDAMFRPATIDILTARTAWLREQGKNTLCWNYLVSAVIPYLGGIALYHCGDIPFAFRNVESEALLCTAWEYAEELEDRMSEAWLAFMKNGDPSTERLLWPPYTEDNRERMQFDAVSKAVAIDDAGLLDLNPMKSI